MKPEDEKRLREIENRADAATPGPILEREETDYYDEGTYLCAGGRDIFKDVRYSDHAGEDAEMFKHARADILWLIERLREAEEVIPHYKISELQPGDTIVFKYPGRISEDALAHLRKSLASIFDIDAHRIVILEEGAELEIVRPAEEAEKEPAHMAELRHDALTNRTAAMLLAQEEAQTKGESS